VARFDMIKNMKTATIKKPSATSICHSSSAILGSGCDRDNGESRPCRRSQSRLRT
jgi:hypothetical protein